MALDLQPELDLQPVKELDIQPVRDAVDEAVGATPKELEEKGHWIQGGLEQTAKDIISIPANFANQLLYNAPRSISRKISGNDFIPMEPESGVAHGLAHAAGVAGAVLSPINKIGVTAKGISLAPRLLGMAAQGAIYSPTEDFTDIGQRAGQAALGAGLGAAGEAISKFKPATEWASQRVYNSAIKPLKRDFAYAKNPGRGLAKEGVTFNSMEEGEQKVGDLLEQRTKELEQTLSQYNDKIDVSGGIDSAIQAAKKKAVDANNEALLGEIKKIETAVKNHLTTHVGEDGVESIVAKNPRNLNDMSLTDALGLKRKIGKLTNYTGNPSDAKPINALKQSLYRVIKGKMEEVAPETAEQNETLADLIGAQNALQHRAAIEARSNLLGLTSKLGGGGLILHGAFTANPHTFGAGLAMIGADKAMHSPFVMTRVASALGAMSRSDVGQVMNAVPWLKDAMEQAGGATKQFIDDFHAKVGEPLSGEEAKVGIRAADKAQATDAIVLPKNLLPAPPNAPKRAITMQPPEVIAQGGEKDMLLPNKQSRLEFNPNASDIAQRSEGTIKGDNFTMKGGQPRNVGGTVSENQPAQRSGLLGNKGELPARPSKDTWVQDSDGNHFEGKEIRQKGNQVLIYDPVLKRNVWLNKNLATKKIVNAPWGNKTANAMALAGVATGAILRAANANAAQGDVDMNKIYQIESSGRSNVVNSKGATGLGQVMKSALADWNQMNPRQRYNMQDMKDASLNKQVSNWYMNKRIPQMLRRAGLKDTLENRLAGYNWGVGNLKSGKPMPKETKNYIRKYKEGK